jgi:hypothetical protein
MSIFQVIVYILSTVKNWWFREFEKREHHTESVNEHIEISFDQVEELLAWVSLICIVAFRLH